MSGLQLFSSSIVRDKGVGRSSNLSLLRDNSSFKSCQQVTEPESAYIQYNTVDMPPDQNIPQQYNVDIAQKWLSLPGKNGKMHTYPVQTFLPKVHMLRKVPPKMMPRDVAVERKRKQFEQLNFIKMLAEAGIDNQVMLPTEEQYYLFTEQTFKHFYPISFFDDSESEHSPEGWINLGYIEGEKHYPVPAEAFVPQNKGLITHSWQYVSVLDYNNVTDKYTVFVLMEEETYHVPKTQVRFLAEDPYIFVNSIKRADQLRNDAECLTKMEFIIDCRTMAKMKIGLDFPIKTTYKLNKLIPADCNPKFVNKLRRELYLVFEHLMTCYEFERFVKLMPKEFADIDARLLRQSLPRAFQSQKAQEEIKYIKSLELDLKKIRRSVLQTFFYYIQAGIEAMMNVAIECQYIETLTIFVCNFAKALPLNDFLQAQQQQSTHVSAYLKEFWPLKLTSGITLVLRPNGRGWLDISLDNWGIYQMCKISNFIFQVKLRMQESMQMLLEKSIDHFCFLLLEPCKSFLQLEDDYVWTSNYIDSEFLFAKPIFSIIISVSDDRKVIYSTPPEEFRPALLEIFKKALEKTSGVRTIEAETMTNMRFAPNLYIMTVELIEDRYIYYDEKLYASYTKAELPLRAYARLYERFIDFYLLNLNDYMNDYKKAGKPSMEVKKDILDHKAQKDELREILPATITIGPFLIQVDPTKQFLIKKHTELVRRLFEYYINRMFESNQEILDRCSEVYRILTDRPISIEHLLQTRDYALTVPDLVEEIRADIQIMWLEYELLDSFFYNLSDGQFAMKWEAYGWPHKILQRLLPLREEQKVDIEDFKRIHLSECIGLGERLESLNEEVQAFSLYFDPEKVQETSVEIKKVWTVIKELRKQGEVLVYRQTLFELEPLSLEFLDSIVRGFTPYRTLWSTCAEVIKLEEATIGNPIAVIELEDVWANILQYRNILKECCDTFSEKPEVKNVAEVYLKRLDDFVPIFNGIKWLKNEYWLFIHWQELAQRTGADIKYTAAINFQYLIRKGIMEHLEIIHEISDKAEYEADELRRQAEEEERRQQDALQQMLLRKAQRKCRRDIL